MRRLIVLGLWLVGCGGGGAGVEGGWGAESQWPPAPPYLHLEGGRYTSLGECNESGAYHQDGAAAGPYDLPGTEITFAPEGQTCGPARSFVWTGDRLWLRGARVGAFEVGYVRE